MNGRQTTHFFTALLGAALLVTAPACATRPDDSSPSGSGSSPASNSSSSDVAGPVPDLTVAQFTTLVEASFPYQIMVNSQIAVAGDDGQPDIREPDADQQKAGVLSAAGLGLIAPGVKEEVSLTIYLLPQSTDTQAFLETTMSGQSSKFNTAGAYVTMTTFAGSGTAGIIEDSAMGGTFCFAQYANVVMATNADCQYLFQNTLDDWAAFLGDSLAPAVGVVAGNITLPVPVVQAGLTIDQFDAVGKAISSDGYSPAMTAARPTPLAPIAYPTCFDSSHIVAGYASDDFVFALLDSPENATDWATGSAAWCLGNVTATVPDGFPPQAQYYTSDTLGVIVYQNVILADDVYLGDGDPVAAADQLVQVCDAAIAR